MPSASGAIIHHNNFHHNRRHGLGYAVDIDSVVAGIYANVFDWGRHAIAATGKPGTGYVATYNLVGPMFFLTAETGLTGSAYSFSYMFDMQVSGKNHGGMVIDISHNSFYGKGSLGVIHIEGIPDVPSTVAVNYFDQLAKDKAVSQRIDDVDTLDNFVGLSVINNQDQS